MQLKYSNYVAFSHNHGFAVNNSGYIIFLSFFPLFLCLKNNSLKLALIEFIKTL